MWWYLAWISVLLGVGTTSTAATYVAVAHYGLLERIAAIVLRKGLKGLTLKDAAHNHPGYRVTRVQGGVQLEDLRFSRSVLDKLGASAINVEAASVAFFKVTFPTFVAPFRLKVRGLKFSVRQRNMPKHMEASFLAEGKRKEKHSLEQAKLQAIDRLLWGAKTGAYAPLDNSKGTYGSRMRSRILHRIVAFCVEYLEVDAEDLKCSYSQEKEPGPLPDPQSHMEGQDGAEVSIRRLLLAPQQKGAAVSGKNLTEHEDAQIELLAETEEEPSAGSFLRLFKIPTMVWKQMTLNEQRSTRAVISGVNISLLAFGMRQPPDAGEGRTEPLPVSAASPGTSQPFLLPAGWARGARLGAQEGAPPSSVRRKRQRREEARPPTAAHSDAAESAVAAPETPPEKPTEVHVLLRQWGAEVTVTALPPFHQGDAGEQRRPSQNSCKAEHSKGGEGDVVRHKPVPSPFASIDTRAAQANGRAHHDNQSDLEDGSRPDQLKGSHPGIHNSAGSVSSISGTEESSAPAPCCSATVSIDIKVRAFMPHFTPQSVAVAFRMLDRAQEYSQYSPYWQTRPSVPVSRSPSLWWQHAGSAAARECRLISRRQVPARDLERRRANRLRYHALYARTHAHLNSFTEPRRHWWQRRQTPRGGAEEAALLKTLEEQLTLEEIAHFRAGVAAVYSSALLYDRDHLQHALDAVDAVVGNLGPLPAPVAAMLFQNEAQVGSAPVLALSAAASCPKIGLLLSVEGDKNPLTAPLPGNNFSCFEACVSNVGCRLDWTGGVELAVESIIVNGQQSLGSSVKEHLLRSPSAAANRMLQVADLHGVVSQAKGFNAKLRSGGRNFLVVHLSSEAGHWPKPKSTNKVSKSRSMVAEIKPPYAAVKSSSEHMDIKPPGLLVHLELAGIEVEYNKHVVLAALNFYKHLAQLKDRPLLNQATAPNLQLPQLKADPGQPATLSERVFHAFAQQNMPVYKPLSLPVTRLKLSCPGLAARVPYKHSTAVGCQQPFSEAGRNHELIAAVTRIQVEVGGEDFREFMREGAIQRTTVHAYLDLFCYQPPSHRRRGEPNMAGSIKATAFGNRTISGQRREGNASEGVDELEDLEAADGQDMAAMAKVWAHPEDLHKYPLGGMPFRGPTAGVFPAGISSRGAIGGRNRRMPAYPMIPLLKISGLQLEAAQKVLSLPAAPGSLMINVAASLHGIMMWISPWQVAHLLSIMEVIKGDLPSNVANADSPTAAQKAGASAMRTQLCIQASLEVPLISAICSVARSQAEFDAAVLKPRSAAAKGQWQYQIPESDPAYLWAQCLAPTYGINILGTRAGLSFRGTGHLRGGLTIDGLLVRDLQLRPKSKFAYFLRPLPARAEELTQHATKFRTRMLRVVTTSRARSRWLWAIRKLVLRRRSTMPAAHMERGMFVQTAALPYTSFVGLKRTGPQLVACCYLPPAEKYPGHPDYKPAPPAKLQIQVGQLLLYARVSSNNRMLPFCSQIIDVFTDMATPRSPRSGPDSGVRAQEAKEIQAVAKPAAKSSEVQKQSGASFAGLSVEIGVVGVDLKIVVQGRELVSLQLLDAQMTLEMAPAPPPSLHGSSVALGLRIIDMSIRDLQAIPEHSMVLRPNKRAEHCSLALDYSTPLDTKQAPLLLIEFANPRILALFRFVYDILHGIDIINAAFAKNGGVFPSASAETTISATQAADSQSPAPEILIHFTNAGIVLPASSKSLRVLVADVDYVMLGMPGNSLSDTALHAAGLPSVKKMLQNSKQAAKLFKTTRPQAGAESPASPNGPQYPGDSSQHSGGAEKWFPKESKAEARPRPAPASKTASNSPLRIVEGNLSEERRNSRNKTGVLFLEETPEPTLPLAYQRGVLSIPKGGGVGAPAAQDSKQEGALRSEGPSNRSGSVDRDGGPTASTSGRDQVENQPQCPPAAYTKGPSHEAPTRAAGVTNAMASEQPLGSGLPGEDSSGPDLEYEADSTLPAPMLAIFAEGLVVSRAALKSLLPQTTAENTFCPKSVFHFAWPVLDFVTVDRSPFVQPSSYSILMYEQKCAQTTSGSYQHLHLAAAPTVVIMNAPNYAALLGFAQGNLVEISSYDNGKKEAAEAPPLRTKFNPNFQFAPPRNDMPTFRMTAAMPLITTVFEADPRHWQSGVIRSRLGDPAELPRLPFMRARVQNIEMDLGLLERSGATYMRFAAAGASCDDLRLAYSKMMTECEVCTDDASEKQHWKHAHTEFPGERDDFHRGQSSMPQAVIDEAAQEIQDQVSMSSTQGVEQQKVPEGRRARSGEFLRMKSMQMHKEQLQKQKTLLGSIPQDPGSEQDDLGEPSLAKAPIPVVSMEVVSSLEAYFPTGSPVVHLLEAPAVFPATEAEHLTEQGRCQHSKDIVGATIALLKDGTIAVEVSLAVALVQWPFLTDISLAWAAASIFDANYVEGDADPSQAAASSAADAILNNAAISPWLYFNCILHDSQLFIPVADPTTLLEGVNHYFGGGAAAMNLHERLADLLLIQLSISMEDSAELQVEERGLAVTWSALRVSYAMGGDGKSDIRTDLRHLAAFVRDPGAIVTCLLLPLSCSMHLEMQVPQAQERQMAKRQQRAVVLIQRAWRRRRWQRAAERSMDRTHRRGSSRPQSQTDRPIVLGLGQAAKLAASEAGIPVVSQLSQQQRSTGLMEQLVQEVASPRTHAILKDYYEQSKAAGGVYHQKKDPSSMHMRLKLGSCTVRAAFSHVPFIQTVIWMTNRMVLQPSPGNLTADSNNKSLASPETEAGADFRPSTFHMDGSLQSISLVLCNDKPETFGAPDVLRLSVNQLAVKYVMDQRFQDRPPDQVAEADLHLFAQFLNNSSSRWEAVCENWHLQAELVDNVSPIYRSDFHRHIWLTSKQHLSVYFNPSALLSLGDFLAFTNAVSTPLPSMRGIAGHTRVEATRLGAPEAAPEMLEQMAQRGSITSRVPQKYLIQNQSGLRVYYWADGEGMVKVGPLRTNSLDSGVSETLKVTPRRKVLQHITPCRGGVGKLQNVINLHFEGNWMPIKDVAVSVVGKYRYQMYSPAEHDHAPVVVDIILVGRTKIITLHSGIWLENRLDRKVSFRLHVPITPLVAPGRPADQRQRHSDNVIGPLKPGSGIYLPVTAVLGGLLFVRPSGFQEAKRDVIRLSPTISEIESQQGHITCEPLDIANGGPAVQAPLHCSLLIRAAQVNSEFQAFKHIEMLAPGEFTRATESLEATLAVHPTLVLTNALPYVIEVIVWQVPPFRKLRQEKTRGRKASLTEYLYYDFQQMRTAFTGTVPIIGEANPYAAQFDAEGGEEQQAPSIRASLNRRSRTLSLLSSPRAVEDERTESPSNSGSETDPMEGQQRRQARRQFWRKKLSSRLAGEHINFTLAPGAFENVYADMGGNVLVHLAIPALGMVASHWAVVSWSKEQITRETCSDAKYIYRLPKDIKLRNLESRMCGKGKTAKILGVAEYISKLKAAGQKFREVAQLHRRQKVQHESPGGGGGLRAGPSPSHIKYPSDGTPLGPAVPTALPTEEGTVEADPLNPGNASVEPEHPRWFNVLYGSKPPSPGSESSGQSSNAVYKRTSNVTLRAPLGDEVLAGRPGSSGKGLVGAAGSGFGNPAENARRLPVGTALHSTATFEAPGTDGLQSPVRGLSASSSFPFTAPDSEGGNQPHNTQLDTQALPPLRVPGQIARARSAELGEIQPHNPCEGLGESRRVLSASASAGPNAPLQRNTPGEAEPLRTPKKMDGKSLGYMRAAFDAWREYAVRKATGHTGLMRQSRVAGVNAPEVLLLNMQNSLAQSEKSSDNPICHLSFYSPYWVDNRTNMDLILQDHASAAPNPVLLGYTTPLDYAEVISPAVGLTDPETPGGAHRSFWDIDNPSEIQVQPALLNKQETTRFCLADVPRRQFSNAIHINTVGLKGSMRVRGPLPSQRVHIATAVREGMRSVFRSAGGDPLNEGPQASEASSEWAEDDAGDPEPRENFALEAASVVEERVKVNIVPLVTVDIQELLPQDSGDTDAAAVFIRPRQPATTEKLVSLALEVTSRRSSSRPSTAGTRRRSLEDGACMEIMLEGGEEDPQVGTGKLKERRDMISRAMNLHRSRDPTAYKVGQREFDFVVEVTSAPPSSVFRLTKVLTIKPRFVVDNQTGMRIEVKQRGTPDIDADPLYGGQSRCSSRLEVGQRAALHWDNAELEKALMVRPLGESRGAIGCEWQWSGGFHLTLSTSEEYFGLRVRHKTIKMRSINIPVNCTVGPSGCVLVTFKSRLSVPPYRIENKTSDVVVSFAQAGVKDQIWDRLVPRPGGSAMAYAWDEPAAEHKLKVLANIQNRVGKPFNQTYELDKLGSKPFLNLPSANKTFSSSSTLTRIRTLQREMTNVPNSLKERVASVLASEFSKKVYVTVFADGPTRVLRFSDEPSTVAVEAEQSVLDLAARIKQVEADLKAVNGKFLQLHGPAGGAELDLYGRAATLHPPKPQHEDPVSRAESYKDSRPNSYTGRIRLRQRGSTPGEGSPLTLYREPVSNSEFLEGSDSDARSVPPGLRAHSKSQEKASLRRKPSEALEQNPSMRDVIQPQDLGHHLANLHIPASSQTVQGSELMRSATATDSALLLGGDLVITVWQAEGLLGNEKVTHPFVSARIGEQLQSTSVQWQRLNPRWEEALNFREVNAASELHIELRTPRDVGGRRGAKKLQRDSEDPSKVIANARFLGSVEIPLSSTMAMSRGNKHWFPLMRRSAADNVSGSIRLSFGWNVTARSLLSLKLGALERVLAQRSEVLCMLNPVSADSALRWAKEDAQQQQLHSSESPEKVEDVERSDPSTTRSEERSLAEMLLAKHKHEEHHSTLTVSVIEARGLMPRSGVVVAFQANQLPNPMVEIAVPGHPSHTVAAKHTVKPRFENAEPANYRRLSSASAVTVRMYDRKGRKHLSLLGENKISCSRLEGDKPMYVWLPLLPSMKARSLWGLRQQRQIPSIESHMQEETPELQVLLRLQWRRQVVRGQYMNAELSLAGMNLIVMGGLQDELFNLTMDRFQVSAEKTHLEARFSGSIKRVQLDNQMLDATQPVVLAPATAAHAHSRTAQALTGDTALIEFRIARSFAYSVLHGAEQVGDLGHAGNREHSLTNPVGRDALQGKKMGEGTSSIMSFKEIWIAIGELDFQADDGFLEAILSFVVSIPMADVWQDEAWREQQRKLLTAQFGPREVETLSMNAVLPIDLDTESLATPPLEWLQSKELRELQVLRDQSSYASWYFIERAYIGEINANVTIALTSSVLGSSSIENAGGLFSRLIRASGFQLINVNNVPLSLGSWSLDTSLLGRKAMISSLARHYKSKGLAEAHKVLGGAGPAITAVPLTVVWVGGSFVTLLTGISSGKVGPIGAAQRIGYVFFMSVAQVVSSLSRIGLSLMTFAPPNRVGHFSDSWALTRAVQRPANAFEAFGRGWEELFDSFMAALVGVLLDPTQGYHTGGIPLAATGFAKGLLGIAVRPAVGILELVSKGTHGMGLVCLGREAITGSAQRRVRAPGALAEEHAEAVDDAREPELQAQQRGVVAAWQQSLGHMFPYIKDDTVMEVVNTQAARTLLLCKDHVALVRSKTLALRSTYKSLWSVPTSEIKIVRGEDDKLLINLEYTTKYDAKCFGVWKIPKRKSIRCGSRDLMERIIVKINRHMSGASKGKVGASESLFDPFESADLSIYQTPYSPGPLSLPSPAS